MGGAAITARAVGKKYVIGASDQTRPDTFRDALVSTGRSMVRRLGGMARGRFETAGPTEEFWALQDLDFEIQQGDAVGIIGRNGAGKSTLLKLLSRITEPTTGRIELNGRVASLLEVGTGFHPELTGRENIYLNGAILGMTRSEIRRKFDEIVEFAGVERFLDTPVKRYSSGMYVRLAFAVAAHLEPEVLVVDEVLAVGDAEFQKKCLGKMGQVAGEGRTVLFVSHNMAAVQALCTKGILLKHGRLAVQGPIAEVQEAYIQDSKTIESGRADLSAHQVEGFRFEEIELCGAQTGEVGLVQGGEDIVIRVTYAQDGPLKDKRIVLTLKSFDGAAIFVLLDEVTRVEQGAKTGRFVSEFKIQNPGLVSAEYIVELRVGSPVTGALMGNFEACRFSVETDLITGGLKKSDGWFGQVLPPFECTIQQA